jgi:3-phenylpropionate/trans-cinnamate dioxygenase ferredoxin subunit
MPEFVKVARVADIPPGARQVFEIEADIYVAVFNVGGKFYAIEDICPHDDGPLAEGEMVKEYVIECPRHGARFDIRDGSVVQMPASSPVPWYPVKVEGDDIYVALEE